MTLKSSTEENGAPKEPYDNSSDNPEKGRGSLVDVKADDTGTPENQDSVDLRKVIQESKERLADEEQAPKRLRGRPRKNSQATKPVGASGAQPVSGTDAALSAQSFSPILSIVVKLPFDTWANNTGCDGVRLADDEAKALGDQFDQCAKAWFPTLNDKTAILIATIGSVAIITMAKYNTLMEFKKAEAKKNPKPEQKAEIVEKEMGPPPFQYPAESFLSPGF